MMTVIARRDQIVGLSADKINSSHAAMTIVETETQIEIVSDGAVISHLINNCSE